MRPVIFLDIDGVLNPHDYDPDPLVQSCGIRDPQVRHLNRVIREADADLVLSSAWRYMVLEGTMTLKGFEYLLRSHGVACAGRLIDTTVSDEDLPGRGNQIRHWIDLKHASRPYCVIDDGGEDHETGEFDDLGIQARGLKVVWTQPDVGLTREDADLAIGILRGEPFVCPTCSGSRKCPACRGDMYTLGPGGIDLCKACDTTGYCPACSFDCVAEAARRVAEIQGERPARRPGQPGVLARQSQDA